MNNNNLQRLTYKKQELAKLEMEYANAEKPRDGILLIVIVAIFTAAGFAKAEESAGLLIAYIVVFGVAVANYVFETDGYSAPYIIVIGVVITFAAFRPIGTYTKTSKEKRQKTLGYLSEKIIEIKDEINEIEGL